MGRTSRTRRSMLVILAVTAISVAAACAPAARPVEPTAGTSVPAPTEIFATRTPEIHLELKQYELVSIPGSTLFLGTVENSLEIPLSELQLELELRNPDGSLTAALEIRPVPSTLAPGEIAGLWMQLEPLDTDLIPSLTLSSYSEGPLLKSEVEIEILETRTSGSGQTIILGTLTNRQFGYARLDDLILLPKEFTGERQGVARLQLANQGLPPDEAVPFTAEVLGEIPQAGWQVYLAASPFGTPDTPRLEIVAPPEARHSTQGTPFFIFQIRNPGSLSRWLKGQVAFYRGEELIALARLDTPVPIRPGETRPFSISELVGLPTGVDISPDALEGWEAELIIDALASRPALQETRLLRLEVSQFEQIGDLIYLRGELTNDNPDTVERPSALVAARDVAGNLLDSAWTMPQEVLAAGESVEFEVTMLLPAGVTAELSEFDLQGLGLASP